MTAGRSSTRTLQTDEEVLKDAADIQQSSKNALARVQNSLTETQDVGASTLEELYAQRRKLENADAHADRLHDNLDQTDYLQSKLGSWFGGKKKKKHKKKELSVASEKENKPKEVTTSSSSSSTSKQKWSFRKSSKKSEAPSLSFPAQFLDKEQTLYQGEHKDQLQQLNDGDQEINAQLDQVGKQLGSILTMAQELGSETKNQGRQLEAVDQSMADAQQRQKKANKKLSKMLK